MNAETLEPLIRACLDECTAWRPEQKDEVAGGLAGDLAGKLPPTFDEVVGVMLDLKQQGKQVSYLKQFWNGAGAVHDSIARDIVSWPASDTPGKDAIAAIKAAMKPEPTAKEKALEAMATVTGTVRAAAFCNLDAELEIIRKVLEGET